ncbi:glycosyltransferase [Cohnella hashimotonis]|uniref:Glycosyltransferase family 2 protein n=1 Tax=Cohnella hashimotonis TaxID=2826895 RepID=A0ABT6TVQ0_9BACL|nr:glycosyltransferase family 2 protein [Cohnella hashimotonis]MDI4650303.1 glycosyltransferase family 2 protein [Cohnella hashimotonis]
MKSASVGGTEHAASVAICIVTFNSAEYIGNCLDHISRQTWSNLRTIIVDNASVDNTLSIINNHPYPTDVIKNPINRGFAAAQNQAIQAGLNSNYFLVLNPDVSMECNYIYELINVMEKDSDIGSACGCLCFANEPNIVDSTGLAMNWARRASDRGSGRLQQDFIHEEDVFGVSGAAGMYRSAMIKHISLQQEFFDEDFFVYKEDVDVAWRAQLLGWRARYIPSARALHIRQWRSSVSRSSMSLKTRKHSYINRYLSLIKNENLGFKWWLRVPLFICYEVAINGFLILKDPAVLGAWKGSKRLLTGALQKRRQIKEKMNEL